MNYIWFGLIVISIIFGAVNNKLADVTNAMLTGAELAIDVVIGLLGIMVFWLGIMKIAEKSGIVETISKLLKPIAKFLFPEIPEKNKATGDIAMNFTANALGLANAATPMGLKAMEELQKINKDKTSASNSMCMLLAMNTSGFQIIPATVIAILVAKGSTNPTEIIIPTFIVTLIAFTSAILCAKFLQFFWTPQQDENEVKND